MKQLKQLFFFLFLANLLSCTTSFGEKYVYENLEIFFTEEIEGKYVEDLAKYFHQNGLIQDETHSVQLTSDALGSESAGFVLKMVLNSDYKQLPTTQNRNLELLEQEIRSVVFDDLNFRIEVCNANFIPLSTLN